MDLKNEFTVDQITQCRQDVEAQVQAEFLKYGQAVDQEQSSAFTSAEVLDALGKNEDGDARLFIELNRGRFCYDTAERRWYVWTDHFWSKDILSEVIAAINAVIDIYGKEAKRQAWQRLQNEKCGHADEAKQHKIIEDNLLKRIKALQTVKRKENILTLARAGSDSLAIRGDKWDAHPWLLPCQNGIIDLKTGGLRPGEPADYIKTVAPIEYHGLDIAAPIFERFISEIFNGDMELISFIQRLLGYGITGLTTYHVYPIFYGPQGRNGKSSLLEIIKFVLGDLAYKARSETLLESRHAPQRGSADADTLAFKGKRIIWASETAEGRKLNAARIKELSGGDTLNARAPYGRDTVEFSPTHLLILLTNECPQAKASDLALWERIHLIPFTVHFVDDPKEQNEKKADHELLEKLKFEAPGILAWLVRGCLDWQGEGLNPPDCVKAATQDYRKEEDLIERFLEDRCLVGPHYEIRAGVLYKNYHAWAEEMGLKPITGILFGQEMQRRFDSYKKRHVFYIGLGILDMTEVE